MKKVRDRHHKINEKIYHGDIAKFGDTNDQFAVWEYFDKKSNNYHD